MTWPLSFFHLLLLSGCPPQCLGRVTLPAWLPLSRAEPVTRLSRLFWYPAQENQVWASSSQAPVSGNRTRPGGQCTQQGSGLTLVSAT